MQVWDLGRLYKTQVSRNEIWNVNYCFSNVLFWQKNKKDLYHELYMLVWDIILFGQWSELGIQHLSTFSIQLQHNGFEKDTFFIQCICDKWHQETEYFSWSYINSMTPRQHLIFQKQHYVQLLIRYVKRKYSDKNCPFKRKRMKLGIWKRVSENHLTVHIHTLLYWLRWLLFAFFSDPVLFRIFKHCH
jgi:hypothetical protein